MPLQRVSEVSLIVTMIGLRLVAVIIVLLILAYVLLIATLARMCGFNQL